MKFLKNLFHIPSLLVRAVFRDAGRAIPVAITNCKIGLKAKQFKYPLLCALFTVSLLPVLTILLTIIFNLLEDPLGAAMGLLTIVLLPFSIAGLWYSLSKMPAARLSLADYCDACGTKMNESFVYLKKNVQAQTPQKTVYSSHYELEGTDDNRIIAKRVTERSTQRSGNDYYKVEGDIQVSQCCPSCQKKNEYEVKGVAFTVWSKKDIDDPKKIKEAVFESLLRKKPESASK